MGKEFPGKCCDYNQMGFFISWNRSIICELALQIQVKGFVAMVRDEEQWHQEFVVGYFCTCLLTYLLELVELLVF